MDEEYDSSMLGKHEKRCSALFQPLKAYGFDYDANEADETEEDVEDEWSGEDDEENDISEFSDEDYLRSPFL
ncbi:uncharacterized protein ACHE_40620S [Aspergillus chevalieri]|uniref:Uncharacterized protein n=1 Tax=Aspergillus chevalieri TaxID=182096 RepID=A0A7R7ZNZ0_ASPCH|nr:uncharacterized protein ACHE_40620S [Aspergillus chevalieri]BCR88056.1 hypothetical protein ACHE_40620S [Aspergillus chevalieri]